MKLVAERMPIVQEGKPPVGLNPSDSTRLAGLTLLGLLGTLVWSYWSTFLELIGTWQSDPDYSHGFLVIPLWALFLWVRRDRMPVRIRPSIAGMPLLCISFAMRVAGARLGMTPFDGWSLVVWCLGSAWCLGGYRFMRWTLAPTLFLLFMVPLPYRLETLLSQPLQNVATNISSFGLRCLGQPAFADGLTILLGDHSLEIEPACSGLRIFVGVFALASALLLLSRAEFWEAVLLLLAVVPVALVANAARIVITGLLFQYSTQEAARSFSHDVAGWLMLPLAASMLGCVYWYLQWLFVDVVSTNVGELVKQQQARCS